MVRQALSPLPTEAFVSWVWQHGHLARELHTSDGRRLQIVYPGRRGGGWGPDFRGALLVLDGSVVRGDVEIHVRPSGWHLHGHATNPDYGNTVLHVVYREEPSLPAVRPDGTILPMIATEPYLTKPVELLLAVWHADGAAPPAHCLELDAAAMVLERAGWARFQSRVDRFEGDLACVDPDQALWAGALEALGYSQNAAPCRELATRVPLTTARATLHAGRDQLEALLLGEAGLLPSQRGWEPLDDHSTALEDSWLRDGASGWAGPLPWRWVGCRPSNTPPRRVAAAAGLLADAPGLDHEAVAALARTAARPSAVQDLRALIARSGSEYWQVHADLGRPLRRSTALVGAERAADVVVNVLLPWAAALGRASGDRALENGAAALYGAHPPLGSNQVTRHMAQQILGSGARALLRSACVQQGLIHVYHGWCDDRLCAACPAGTGAGAGSF
ncbi:MAG: hypothetical protein QOF51_417 [Chloroflexota bacterium]|nr:hypothetical protein [Chloroflexota bacterium]